MTFGLAWLGFGKFVVRNLCEFMSAVFDSDGASDLRDEMLHANAGYSLF